MSSKTRVLALLLTLAAVAAPMGAYADVIVLPCTPTPSGLPVGVTCAIGPGDPTDPCDTPRNPLGILPVDDPIKCPTKPGCVAIGLLATVPGVVTVPIARSSASVAPSTGATDHGDSHVAQASLFPLTGGASAIDTSCDANSFNRISKGKADVADFSITVAGQTIALDVLKEEGSTRSGVGNLPPDVFLPSNKANRGDIFRLKVNGTDIPLVATPNTHVSLTAADVYVNEQIPGKQMLGCARWTGDAARIVLGGGVATVIISLVSTCS